MRLSVELLLGLPYALLAALTAMGSVRRGIAMWLSALAGLGFPVTWVAWYVRDVGFGSQQRTAPDRAATLRH